MADKKYIGKPGKQDDPCWKGYEMVGMKKKNGRKVPNCVPEAREIIEKAKKKTKDWTGAKVDKDRFILPEEHENCGTPDCCGQCDTAIDEATVTGNPGYGYHGNIEARDDKERDKRYSAAHTYLKKFLGDRGHLQDAKQPNKMVKHFLDSTHGRHLAQSKMSDRDVENRFKHFKKSYDPAMHEEVEIEESISNMSDARLKYHATKDFPHGRYTSKEIKAEHNRRRKAVPNYHTVKPSMNEELEEAYGMWKVDFPKQHVGKAVAAGSVHVKAQNVAHAHKVAAKRVGVDHKVFKSKVTKSSILPEELEEDTRSNAAAGNGAAWFDKFRGGGHNIKRQKLAKERYKKTGVLPGSATSTADAMAKFYAKGGVATKLDTKGNVKEELGKSNEWGRPELRKKYAAMTPGQEGMTADQIPTFDPRYDDVTTQFSGLHPVKEENLNEISAKGAIAREKFRQKLQKRLADPKAIAKAKKTLAKKKEEEKKAPKNLVHQLHKSISVGSKVTFHDGKEHEIAPNHADKFMSKYHSLKSSIEKEALVKRAHKSHDSFMTAIHEETEMCQTDNLPMGQSAAPCTCDIEGPNYPTAPVNNNLVDYNKDGREDEYDEAQLENDVASDIEFSEWEDLVDYYENDDLEWEDEDEGEDLEEAITPQGRLKKKFNAMRTKTRRNMARNLALKRVATPDRIKARSIRAARNMVYSRMLRGRDRSTLSSTEKQRIEAQVKRMAPMVSRLSVRLQQKERQIDRARVTNRYKKKKGKK